MDRAVIFEWNIFAKTGEIFFLLKSFWMLYDGISRFHLIRLNEDDE